VFGVGVDPNVGLGDTQTSLKATQSSKGTFSSTTNLNVKIPLVFAMC
jgi:hypothetical protein